MTKERNAGENNLRACFRRWRTVTAQCHTLQSVAVLLHHPVALLTGHAGQRPVKGSALGDQGANSVLVRYEPAHFKLCQMTPQRARRDTGAFVQLPECLRPACQSLHEHDAARVSERCGCPEHGRDGIGFPSKDKTQCYRERLSCPCRLSAAGLIRHVTAFTPGGQKAARLQRPQVLTGHGDGQMQTVGNRCHGLIGFFQETAQNAQAVAVGQHPAGAPESRLQFAGGSHGHTLQSVALFGKRYLWHGERPRTASSIKRERNAAVRGFQNGLRPPGRRRYTLLSPCASRAVFIRCSPKRRTDSYENHACSWRLCLCCFGGLCC